MKKIDLGQILTILANIGMLIGILLLAYELNQNRRMAAAQTRNELQQGLIDLLAVPAANMQLTELIVRGNEGEELTSAEALRLRFRNEMTFRYWENVHYQYRQGLYDEVEFSKHLETMEGVIERNKALVEYWCQDRHLYSVPFAEEIDGMLDTGEC